MTTRTPNQTAGMRRRGEFWVEGCANCPHPGGLHVIDQWEPPETHCRCCADCQVYAPGEFIRWSDQQTDALAGVPGDAEAGQ